jgi:hypothetical protein
MATYSQLAEGEWETPPRKAYWMACCDCGLTHRMNFRLVKGKRGKIIQFRVFRDERATGQIRRHSQKKEK